MFAVILKFCFIYSFPRIAMKINIDHDVFKERQLRKIYSFLLIHQMLMLLHVNGYISLMASVV